MEAGGRSVPERSDVGPGAYGRASTLTIAESISKSIAKSTTKMISKTISKIFAKFSAKNISKMFAKMITKIISKTVAEKTAKTVAGMVADRHTRIAANSVAGKLARMLGARTGNARLTRVRTARAQRGDQRGGSWILAGGDVTSRWRVQLDGGRCGGRGDGTMAVMAFWLPQRPS